MDSEQNPYDAPISTVSTDGSCSNAFAKTGRFIGLWLGVICGALLLFAVLANTISVALKEQTFDGLGQGILVALAAGVSMCLAIPTCSALVLFGVGYVVGFLVDQVIPDRNRLQTDQTSEPNE